MNAFQVASELDTICRNCKNFDFDLEDGGMHGICKHAKMAGKSGRTMLKEANQYCDEVMK